MEPPLAHIPVLLEACERALKPAPGQTMVDCTAGLGGHAAHLAPALAPGGAVVLNDVDAGNLARAEARVRAVVDPSVRIIARQGNFAALPRWLVREGLRADTVLADLGFASNQMDDPSRGLAFSRDGPLDMRLDPSAPITAAELVNTLPEPELARIFREFGEERAATPVARKIVEIRRAAPITTTAQLASVVRSVVRPSGPTDPATRTFQALRIAVNDELGSLEGLLAAIERAAADVGNGWLRAGARVAVVSFHSLEDRPVKRAFGRLIRSGHAEAVGPQPATPDEAETGANPRSRSAKLRAIRLVGRPSPVV